MIVISGASMVCPRTGNAGGGLAHALADALECIHVPARTSHFPDGEMHVNIQGFPSEGPVVIVQSARGGMGHTHDHMMEQALLVDAVRQRGSGPIILVMPYVGYARQHRGGKTGDALQPLARQMVMRMLQAAGVDGCVTVDMHGLDDDERFWGASPNFGDVAVWQDPCGMPLAVADGEALWAEILLKTLQEGGSRHTQQLPGTAAILPEDSLGAHPQNHSGAVCAGVLRQKYCVVAPDKGSWKRAQRLGARLGWDVICMHKVRTDQDCHMAIAGFISADEQIRDFRAMSAENPMMGYDHFLNTDQGARDARLSGRSYVMIDDIVDTGQTILQAVRVLDRHGARPWAACITHPVFSRSGLKDLMRWGFHVIWTTDTIRSAHEGPPESRVASVAPLLARGVRDLQKFWAGAGRLASGSKGHVDHFLWTRGDRSVVAKMCAAGKREAIK